MDPENLLSASESNNISNLVYLDRTSPPNHEVQAAAVNFELAIRKVFFDDNQKLSD